MTDFILLFYFYIIWNAEKEVMQIFNAPEYNDKTDKKKCY